MRGEGGTRTLGLRRATPTLYQLSYNPMVRDRGVEPVSLAPKASGSAISLVPEVMPPAGPYRCRPGSCYAIHCGVENLQRRRPQPGREAGATGLEPATFGFGDRCSTS